MWHWFRNCASCGSSWPPVDLYCERCWTNLFNQGLWQQTPTEHGPIEYFWKWSRDQSEIGEFIKQRKSDLFSQAHQRIVKKLFCLKQLKVEALVFPSKNLNKKDHTQSLAEALSFWCKIPSFAILIEDKKQYKNLKRHQRFLARHGDARGLNLVDKKVCFIDDVYTTGATSRSVWEALGRPNCFKSVVLVYKEIF